MGHFWTVAGVDLLLVPAIDVLAAHLAGRSLEYRVAQRLGVFAIAPLAFFLPLVVAIVACWAGVLRVAAHRGAFFVTSGALTVAIPLLAVWAAALRFRLLQVQLELSWVRTCALAFLPLVPAAVVVAALV